jgi:methylamine---corrinoid protein Co-methyltransferase
MIPFFEVIKRALNGPYYSEHDFDMKVVVPKLRAIVKKYGIRFDPENPIANDDKLADDVFQAALELCVETGTYCTDTSRVIRFSREELLEGLRDAPAAPVFGEGRDRKAMLGRKPESSLPPWCYVGAGGATCSSEEVYVRLVEGYGRNPLTDSVTCPTLTKINGMEVVAGSPLELLACIRSVELGRAALRRAQRPGLPIMNSIATAVTDAGKIAGSEFGLRDSDCWVVGFAAEFKVSFQRLNEVAYILARGGQVLGECGPILGGYAGGPEGVAVVSTAYLLYSILILRASAHLTFPLNMRGWNSSQQLLWTQSLSTQAISRNTHLPQLWYTYCAAGPMTEMNLYEIAAGMISGVVSGGNIEFGGVGAARNMDHLSPLEPRFATEVAHAAAGMSRADANEIVRKLVAKYEDKLLDPPKGVPFQQNHDWDSIEPCPEYADLYGRIKDELRGYGLGLS